MTDATMGTGDVRKFNGMKVTIQPGTETEYVTAGKEALPHFFRGRSARQPNPSPRGQFGKRSDRGVPKNPRREI
jgi:hypothetical protein